MLGIAAAFVFVINQDPMNDARTSEARLGNDRIGVSVLCGVDTSHQVAIEFRTDKALRELLNQRTIVEWRFDEGEAQRRQANWWHRRATMTGDDARTFVDGIRSASRLRVRLASAYQGDVVMDVSISDPNGAIEKVIQTC